MHCLHTAVLKRSLNERSQDSFLLCVLNEWYSREQAAPFAAPRSKIFAVRYCALQYCRQALWRGVAACLTDAAGEAEAPHGDELYQRRPLPLTLTGQDRTARTQNSAQLLHHGGGGQTRR